MALGVLLLLLPTPYVFIFFKKEKFNPVAEINRSVSGAIILDRKMPKYFIWEYKKSVEIQDLSL
jgi:hypothetical protein